MQIKDIASACHAIREADGLIIGAGAGMGVDSGLPDFRGREGLWREYPALKEARMEFSEIANSEAFAMSPKLAWGFYGHRLNLYRQTQPHAGFDILRTIGEKMPQGYQVFTSNVDGQFQKAGFADNRIYECHGSIHYLQCSQACNEEIWSASYLTVTTDDIRCQATSELPRCPNCGEIARPNILMFDDYQWQNRYANLRAKQMQKNIDAMQAPVIIECGAGSSIPTVRRFCEAQNAMLIRLNPRESQVAINGIGLECGAKEGLEMIYRTLNTLGYFESNSDDKT